MLEYEAFPKMRIGDVWRVTGPNDQNWAEWRIVSVSEDGSTKKGELVDTRWGVRQESTTSVIFEVAREGSRLPKSMENIYTLALRQECPRCEGDGPLSEGDYLCIDCRGELDG
jgi:hypothetical protein